jgi:flagellar assembly factor FliW
VKLNTRQFGELEFDESIVYHFASGLPGFEELHKFIIINDKDTGPLRWLMSIEDPDIGFPVLEIAQIAPERAKEMPADQLKTSTTFVVVTLNRDPEPMTANLKAPIVLDNAVRTGKQVVINSDKYSTKHIIN